MKNDVKTNAKPKADRFYAVDTALLSIIAIFTLHAGVASSAPGRVYWKQVRNGVACLQDSGNGNVQSIDTQICMNQVGAKVEWIAKSSQGQIGCAEETPEGLLLQFIDVHYCASRLPSHITELTDANGSPVCVRLTPLNEYIETLNPDSCAHPERRRPPSQPVAKPTPQPTPRPTPQATPYSTPRPMPRATAQPTPQPQPPPRSTPRPTPQPTPQPTPLATPETTPAPEETNPVSPEPTEKPTEPAKVRSQHPPGFHWSDESKSSCILYGQDGYVSHLAPPARCRR